MREKYLGAQNLSRLILLFFYEINAKNLEFFATNCKKILKVKTSLSKWATFTLFSSIKQNNEL